MTVSCGHPCFEYYRYLANGNEDFKAMVVKELGIPGEPATCKGCGEENGSCSHCWCAAESIRVPRGMGWRIRCDRSHFP